MKRKPAFSLMALAVVDRVEGPRTSSFIPAMPSPIQPPLNHRLASAYANSVCARLPRQLQDACEAAGLNKYSLWQKCGVSRDMLGNIESAESIPTLHLAARLAWGVDLTLVQFVGRLEDR